ncbi:hypothetical protein PR048_027262 [Dryococelus australis]|uniref:Uncharacterized protein n=1 Tax=Dryococelus australis TaxID=614101 RepID=A0ABQ9GEZ3_9NEOP|nr:hypothetical protein PR048_027262 [Dryococelus australis]
MRRLTSHRSDGGLFLSAGEMGGRPAGRGAQSESRPGQRTITVAQGARPRDGAMTAAGQQRLAASVTRYLSAVVDPRPGRAVHCPDLNACLVNEGRPQRVDCRAVHFGYAIPVTVVPLPDRPDLAELVLDPSPELSPAAVRYLLRHHPQLKDMAAAAEGRRAQFAAEPEDDIAAIAKQISDHAEAIYQTWKARGLAPTEILKCHGGAAAAADRFGPALKPAAPVASAQQPPVDLSLDANNLERLVSTFVSEDKARLAARRRSSPPSSIQFARQKFEKQPEARTATATRPQQPSRIPQLAVSPRSTAEHSPSPSSSSSTSSGLTTWPLKNKAVAVGKVAAVADESVKRRAAALGGGKFSTLPTKNSAEYLDEVAREEERLINALKTGVIIADERAVAKKKSPTASAAAGALLKEREAAPAKKLGPAEPKKKETELAKSRYAQPVAARGRLEAGRTVPHPELTNLQRQHLLRTVPGAAAAAAGANPVRPFLTRGSVAERVLIFEKCPPTELLLDKRRGLGATAAPWRDGHSKIQVRASLPACLTSARARASFYAC